MATTILSNIKPNAYCAMQGKSISTKLNDCTEAKVNVPSGDVSNSVSMASLSLANQLELKKVHVPSN